MATVKNLNGKDEVLRDLDAQVTVEGGQVVLTVDMGRHTLTIELPISELTLSFMVPTDRLIEKKNK